MIFVTSHDNDKDLARQLSEAAVVPIPYGDIVFHGVDEALVCGERKKASDLVRCINDGRHVKQVQDALGAGFNYYFLVVEASFRQAESGEAEYKSGPHWTHSGMSWARLQAYLNELHYQMGVHVMYSSGVRQTADLVRSIYNFFQATEHSSLKKFYAPSPLLLRPPSLVRRVAKEFTGIGWERSLAVEGKWGSVRDMVNATEKEWTEVDGIGKGIARKIREELE